MILDGFYDKDLSEKSLAQTYLEIVIEGARYGVVFPPEMILQAKAIVTAEALDLVLAPDFNFSEEVRPIVARELAKRATPRRIVDRLWDNLAEWILLGELVPTYEVPGDSGDDEKQFHQWAKSALADAWIDDIERFLHNLQAEIPRFTSADYWTAHPERQALMQTCLSLLRLVASSFSRLQQESALDLGPVPAVPHHNGEYAATGAVSPQARWQAFFREDERWDGDTRWVGEEFMQAYAYLEKSARQYNDSTFWNEHHETRASLVSLLTMLRFLVSQLGRTAHESIWQDAE